MNNLRLLFKDQLSENISSLHKIHKQDDLILLCELLEEFTDLEHHPKKIAFTLASMRHFAMELKAKGYQIKYVTLDDPNNTGSLTEEINLILKKFPIKQIIVTEPSEFKQQLMVESWKKLFKVPIDLKIDNRSICSKEQFKTWASGKKQLRMEYFYRELRKQHRILIEANGKPTGGIWNYDKYNRQPPNKHLSSPKRISHKKSVILQEVLKLVKKKFSQHFGNLEPFHYAITRKQALLELHDFINRILPNFGDHQDAMLCGEAYLNHSLLSSYINIGLLLPMEICLLVETAYRQSKVPINAAEGFIRQILGWREYIRGIYWLKMPEYIKLNYLQAKHPLPDFYWGKPTKMACISEVVTHTKEHAYSHHIQRLMVTGNFALIAGLEVTQVQEWYLAVYSDAYEWVELPNTLGMALFGDAGIVGSKPYAASGNYINKMSNFCDNCYYNPKESLGNNACPFNALYWDFFARNRKKLQNNQRLSYMYNTWDKFSPNKQQMIINQAKLWLQLMQENKL